MERGSVVDAQIEFEQQKEILQERAFEVFEQRIKSPIKRAEMKEYSENLFNTRSLQTTFPGLLSMGMQLPVRSKPFKEIYGSAQ